MILNSTLLDENKIETSIARTISKRQAELPEEVESEEDIERRSYGSVLRYECGLARMFWDPDLEEEYQVISIFMNMKNILFIF